MAETFELPLDNSIDTLLGELIVLLFISLL